jgi:hypothetical protein
VETVSGASTVEWLIRISSDAIYILYLESRISDGGFTRLHGE